MRVRVHPGFGVANLESVPLIYLLLIVTCKCHDENVVNSQSEISFIKVRIFSYLVYTQDNVQKSHKSPEVFKISTRNIFIFILPLLIVADVHIGIYLLAYQLKLYNLHFSCSGWYIFIFQSQNNLHVRLIFNLLFENLSETTLVQYASLGSDIATNIFNLLLFLIIFKRSENFYTLSRQCVSRIDLHLEQFAN